MADGSRPGGVYHAEVLSLPYNPRFSLAYLHTFSAVVLHTPSSTVETKSTFPQDRLANSSTTVTLRSGSPTGNVCYCFAKTTPPKANTGVSAQLRSHSSAYPDVEIETKFQKILVTLAALVAST